MLQPTGSVYLDTPRPPRRQPEPTGTAPRAVIAGILAAIGMLSLTAAAVLGVFRVMVHDPETVVGAVTTALDDPAGRADLEVEIADAIGGTLFDDELVASLAAYGIDVEAEATRIAPTVLDDAAFRTALTDLAVRTHERVLLDRSDAPLDMTAITSAVRTVLVREVPEADAVLPDSRTLYIVNADQIPDLTGPIDLLDRLAVAVALGGLLLPLAYIAHPERHRVLRWVGRWLLTLGLFAGSASLAIPWLAARVTGSALVEITVQDLSTRLLAPAAVLGIIGIGMVLAATILKHRSPKSKSVNDVGVAAALGGFDDTWAVPTHSPKDMELVHRGLIDASHPLTNI